MLLTTLVAVVLPWATPSTQQLHAARSLARSDEKVGVTDPNELDRARSSMLDDGGELGGGEEVAVTYAGGDRHDLGEAKRIIFAGHSPQDYLQIEPWLGTDQYPERHCYYSSSLIFRGPLPLH